MLAFRISTRSGYCSIALVCRAKARDDVSCGSLVPNTEFTVGALPVSAGAGFLPKVTRILTCSPSLIGLASGSAKASPSQVTADTDVGMLQPQGPNSQSAPLASLSVRTTNREAAAKG